ncbi:MAG: hypothetical protein ACXWRU_18800 [Pseudobdellovibrionaceae bacterium]
MKSALFLTMSLILGLAEATLAKTATFVPPIFEYFDTSRPLAGVLLNQASQVDEVAGFSNAVGFWTTDLSQVTAFLRRNNGRMLPVLELRGFIFNPSTGIVRADYKSVLKKLAKTIRAVHSGPVLFYVDEPFWNIRMSCYNSHSPQACAEVDSHFANTLSQIRIAGQLLRKAIPGSGIFDVEAFAELAIQQKLWGQVVLLDEAEYLGFDCYGNFNSCGGGSFAGVTISPQPIPTYIDWMNKAIASLEKVNPMGRKILLVPGSFLNTVNFTSEEQTIAHMNAYFDILKTCPTCGGYLSFMWDNLPGIQDTIVGARSLAQVRSALIDILSSISHKNTTAPPPEMTLVGAYQMSSGALNTFLGTSNKAIVGTPATGDLLGIPDYLIPRPRPPMATLSAPSGTDARVYITSVGMDACSIRIDNEAAKPLLANTLSTTTVPKIADSTSIEAKCTSGTKSYYRYFLFKAQ